VARLCDTHVNDDTDELIFKVLIGDGFSVLFFVDWFLFLRGFILLFCACVNHLSILVSLFLFGIFSSSLFFIILVFA
jgi:hypothetical protein